MNSAFGDARTFPATAEAKNLMKQLVTKGLFDEQGDVWRLGAAVGIALGKSYTEGARATFQNVNSLDPDEVFAAVMIGRLPDAGPEERVRALVDHAEWGIREVNRKIENGTLNWMTIGTGSKKAQ